MQRLIGAKEKSSERKRKREREEKNIYWFLGC
jgi:hypothetical protein